MIDTDPESRMIECIRQCSRPVEPIPTDTAPRLDPVAGIRAVVFDIYGTLFASGSGDVGTVAEHTGTAALYATLDAAGVLAPGAGHLDAGVMDQVIREDHAASRDRGIEFPEVDILHIWRQLLNRLGSAVRTDVADERTLRLLAMDYECRTNPVWPMPGLEGTLGELERRDLPLGIVSNAQFYTPLLFPALLKENLPSLGFDPALCAFSYRLGEAKPSLRLFQEVLEPMKSRHGIEPDQILYVGNDLLKDIWPASRLGLRTVLFAGDQRSLRWREDDPRCADTRPDAVITQLAQLQDILSANP